MKQLEVLNQRVDAPLMVPNFAFGILEILIPVG